MLDSELSWFENKKIIVTGCAGTIGQEIVSQLSRVHSVKITGLDINENKIFSLAEKYADKTDLKFFVSDVRDLDGLERHFFDVDVVLHTAALKHVGLGEQSPEQVVATNIIGVKNITFLCKKYPVKKLVFTSSDKAVSPTNVMGASKLMGERLVAAQARPEDPNCCAFITTRFGNVLGSEGSVFCTFRSQLAAGMPISITDTEMTRYMMSISEAVSLVLKSAVLGIGGEIFVTKMPVVNIKDLACAMHELLEKKRPFEYQIIGIKPGEKLFEELMTEVEALGALSTTDFFIVPALGSELEPALYAGSQWINGDEKGWGRSQNEPTATVEQIKQLLSTSGLVD